MAAFPSSGNHELPRPPHSSQVCWLNFSGFSEPSAGWLGACRSHPPRSLSWLAQLPITHPCPAAGARAGAEEEVRRGERRSCTGREGKVQTVKVAPRAASGRCGAPASPTPSPPAGPGPSNNVSLFFSFCRSAAGPGGAGWRGRRVAGIPAPSRPPGLARPGFPGFVHSRICSHVTTTLSPASFSRRISATADLCPSTLNKFNTGCFF